MSRFQPNSYDSIKDKCAKACLLYMMDLIDEECLLTWLIDYKNDYQNKEFKFDYKSSILH